MKSFSKKRRGTFGPLWGGALLGLLFFTGSLWVLGLGCQQKTAPTTSMILTPCPTPILLNGFEDLTPSTASNPLTTTAGVTLSQSVTYFTTSAGVTINPPVAYVPYTTFLTQSNEYATEGTHSLDIDISSACCPPGVSAVLTGYNQNIFILTPPTSNPWIWNNIEALTMDLTVDPSVTAGSTYHTMVLVANTSAVRGTNPYGTYFQPITSNDPIINPGTQTITFYIDFAAGLIKPGDPLTQLQFVYNNNATTGTGNIYVDNMRLIQNCP